MVGRAAALGVAPLPLNATFAPLPPAPIPSGLKHTPTRSPLRNMENGYGSGLIALATLMLLLATSALPARSQPHALGLFEGNTDVGSVKRPGSATYDAGRQEYVVAGAGYNIWFDHDEHHFVWRLLRGDFILRTRAHFLGDGVDPHRKLGWIVRSSLDSNATHVNAVVHGDGLTALQFRRTPGGDTEEIRSTLTGADVVQLARKGNTYTLSVARFGEPFVTEEVEDLNLGDEVYAGLFVCSHNEDVLEQAVFRNVRIIIPAEESFVPYRDYIGSNLETLDVDGGHRWVRLRSPESLQAPNWTPDGKALLYNSNGLLYRFDLDHSSASVINTGFADRNNNDHVLSSDGRLLGISHHSEDHDGRSIIYTVPVEGGTPAQVTPTGPSYLHGWSPDGTFMVYTAERGGDYDIYRIPAAGGNEERLTRTSGLDDGPEYAPDGRYIYFNSVRSGTMQLWRMKPDGSDPEPLTDDAFNNWFPHPSPDGKWIVFLSFGADVDPSDHPFYRQVYLRIIPAEGGSPRVLAYVYGGQGTINVPSWSPDSEQIAFVSNTNLDE